ncbi:MAG: TolC family protein [Magnetococcales bacterium]|nr:TolC family protein [Magnetococcales bacterium]
MSICLVFFSGLSGCTVKPDPITTQSVEQRVKSDLGHLFTDQEPTSYQIGLHEAMARAVKYNLQRRVKQMEEAVAVEDLGLAERDLLPSIAASAGYTFRNQEQVTNLKNSNLQLMSADNKQSDANLTWTWSALDFGVSYVQARQKADRVLIHRQQRRKSTQNIIQEVRTRYWQAALTDLLVPEIDRLLAESEAARNDVQRLEAAGQEVPAIALKSQQILLDTTHQLWEMRKQLVEAKSQLAVLMNLPPGAVFSSVARQEEVLDEGLILLPEAALDHFALLHRPELRESDYEERISALEVRKVLLQMLPNLVLTEGLAHDSNQYLQNQTWGLVGTRLSWDLFNLASTPKKVAIAKLEKDVVRSQRLAFSMAVVTQLRLALQNYHLSKRDLSIARDVNALQVRMVQEGESDKHRVNNTDIQRIQQRSRAIQSRLDQGEAFAEMQSALGRIQLTLGVDPLPLTPQMDLADVQTMSRIIAMRQSSVVTAVISAIPKPLLISRLNSNSPSQAETDTGALSRQGSGAIWDTLEQISDRIEKNQEGTLKWGDLFSANPSNLQSGPSYIPPGSDTPLPSSGFDAQPVGYIPPPGAMEYTVPVTAAQTVPPIPVEVGQVTLAVE